MPSAANIKSEPPSRPPRASTAARPHFCLLLALARHLSATSTGVHHHTCSGILIPDLNLHRPRAFVSVRKKMVPRLSSLAQSADASTRARVGIPPSRWTLAPWLPSGGAHFDSGRLMQPVSVLACSDPLFPMTAKAYARPFLLPFARQVFCPIPAHRQKAETPRRSARLGSGSRDALPRLEQHP